MNDEKEIISIQYEKKLSYLLRSHKELQPAILSWATEMLTEARKDWADMRATTVDIVIKNHNQSKARKGGIGRDKKYKPFREEFAKIQKEQFMKLYQNGKKMTANSFVDWFLTNNPQKTAIPYLEHNKKNKLRQLAQANNREFKKLLLS